MKKNLFLTLHVLGFLSLVLSSCTENERAKKYGGTMTVDLPPNTKFVSASWKEDQLWYVYRVRKDGEIPETFTMKEDSRFGIIQGKVQFVER
jgi:hypothetical protein